MLEGRRKMALMVQGSGFKVYDLRCYTLGARIKDG